MQARVLAPQPTLLEEFEASEPMRKIKAVKIQILLEKRSFAWDLSNARAWLAALEQGGPCPVWDELTGEHTSW